jgi:hypothetical protein
LNVFTLERLSFILALTLSLCIPGFKCEKLIVFTPVGVEDHFARDASKVYS